MTNEAILSVLDSLCNEARNSMHAAFGLLEIPVEVISDTRWHHCMETGRASADRLLKAIDDVRELLSPPAAQGETCEEFDLLACLRETIELLDLANAGEGRAVSVGGPGGPLPVRQNRAAVEQVLMRLVSAARKSAGPGSVRIAGAAGPDSIHLTIGVEDAGEAGRLYHWLSVDPAKACFGNLVDVPSAVAVMVVGRRIRAMGGVVERDDDVATRLSVKLPMLAAIAGRAGSPAAPPRPESLNVLIAEDCDESFALSELLLRGENVWRACHGLQAFELVRKQRFDVVFMDVHMPGIDGYAAIRTIRDWETETGNARTPIVVLSSDDLETQRRSAAQAGCSGFLRKPLRKGELLDVLDRLRAARLLVV